MIGAPRSAEHWLLVVATLLALSASARCAAGATVRPFGLMFTLVGDFPLGTATSRTDYESIDTAAQRLYIAKMGAGKLLAFDTGSNRLVRELSGFPKITAVLAVPELHKIVVSAPGAGLTASLDVGLGLLGLSSGSGEITILDSVTLQQSVRLPGGVFPDGIAYDPVRRRIFVSDEFGAAVTVLDARSDHVLARIALGGQAGNVQYDPSSAKVYVAIQSQDELGVIDPARLALAGRFKLKGCRHPHGLAIAPGAAIAYVACDENDVLLTVDLVKAKVIGQLPLAHDPDVLASDAGLQRLYVATESGNLSTFDISHAAEPAALSEVFIADGAHSLTVDPATHRLYFALANVGGRSVLRVLAPKP